jgi:hypothetical protein
MLIMLNLAWQVIFRLLAILVISISLILLIAQRGQPPSLAKSDQPGFSTCRLPCWAGVMLHQTAFRNALKTVTSNLPGLSLDIQATNAQITFITQGGKSQIAGVIYEDRGTVGSLRLDVTFPLWYLIEEFGRPYCVRANHLSLVDVNVIVIYWRLGDMTVIGVVTLDPEEKWYAGVQVETLLTMTSEDQCALVDAHPWMGFAALWLYDTGYSD